jgi:hypothetical protein
MRREWIYGNIRHVNLSSLIASLYLSKATAANQAGMASPIATLPT